MTDRVKLVLEDGTTVEGQGFGARACVVGELVFNTGMTGYVETLSDPSYHGQIVMPTYPLIGNYGVPGQELHTGLPHPFESPRIQSLGLVVARYEEGYSHHAAEKSLDAWLKQCGVPGMWGVDTRRITRVLREHGTMRAALCPADQTPDLNRPTCDPSRSVADVSTPGVDRYQARERRNLTVMLVDCGAKHNILRSLLNRGVDVVRAPFDHDFAAEDFGVDGLLISNGPGDPTDVPVLIDHLATYLGKTSKPVFGICLGHQVLALALGGRTYKLPYGHRSQNQPVYDLFTRRSYITSQNHGYAVDQDRIPRGFEQWFVNVNDGTCEGIRHTTRPWLSVQFHPEAYPGPVDSGILFDQFIGLMAKA